MKPSAARLLRNQSFLALWLGQFVSIFGDRLHYLALLALIVGAARDPHNPAPELALVPVVSFLPAILIGPTAGVLVDSWETRRVLVVSDFIRGCLVLLLIPAAIYGGLPGAYAIVFLLYVANTFFLPARSAIVPDMVSQDELVEANSLATLAGVAATIAGSFLGGLFVDRAGWRWGFAVDAGSYFVSALFLAATRPRPHARKPRATTWAGVYRSIGRDIQEGARLAVGNRIVLGALLALVSLWVAGGALHVAGTVLVRQRTSGFVSGVGGILSLLGFGMVGGTLLLAWRGRRWSRRLLITVGLAGTGAALVLFAGARHYAVIAALALAAGFFVALLLVTTEAAVQSTVGAEARGRIFALRDFSTRLAVLVTAGLLGPALGRGWLDPAWTVAGAGALLIAAGIWGYARWSRETGAGARSRPGSGGERG